MVQQGSAETGASVAAKDGADPIIDTVIELLDTEGYESVQLREVARRARVSMTTIYRRFPTRDDMIAAALYWWMDTHRYANVAAPPQGVPDGLYEGLMHVFRALFEPWEQHPRLLRAYVRAQAAPGGQRLTEHGFDVVEPAARAILARADPDFTRDIETVLSALVYGLLAQFADGAIAVTDILPRLERAIYWLAKGNSAVVRQSGANQEE